MAFTTKADGQVLYASELNENFALSRNLVTFGKAYGSASTTSSTFQDYLTFTGPAAAKANQVYLFEAWIGWRLGNAGDTQEVRLWNDTTSATAASIDTTTSLASTTNNTIYTAGTGVIVTAGSAHSFKVQYRRSAGAAASVFMTSAMGKITFLEQ